MLVDGDDIRKLRALKVGKTVRLVYDSGESGEQSCGPPAELGPREKCFGWYRVEIDLRRLRPGGIA